MFGNEFRENLSRISKIMISSIHKGRNSVFFELAESEMKPTYWEAKCMRKPKKINELPHTGICHIKKNEIKIHSSRDDEAIYDFQFY